MSKKLAILYQKIDKCPFCKLPHQKLLCGGESAKNNLRHIHGFGASRPKFMLILINPTYRNISSAPKYKGPRFPFIGVRQFWKVLGKAGLINKKITNNLPPRLKWTKIHTKQIQNELLKNKLFLTNIVKCCYDHGDYPDKKVINAQIKFLKKEIEIVRPKKIIAFSALVFKTLVGKSITLSKYWSDERKEKYTEKISGLKIPIIPCYFPIGRGSPKLAVQCLKNVR